MIDAFPSPFHSRQDARVHIDPVYERAGGARGSREPYEVSLTLGSWPLHALLELGIWLVAALTVILSS